MTVDDAAQSLGIAAKTLRGYISLGRFPRPTDGEISPDAVERWRQRQASAIERRKRTYMSPRRTDWVGE